MAKVIIIDNGHGVDCAGKRSPKWADGKQFFEYEFNRDVAARISAMLDKQKIKNIMLVPEKQDISLPQRCERVNNLCKIYGKENCVLISIHANAGGGTGWECYTSKGDTAADKYATILCEQFRQDFPGEKMRFDYSDGDPDKESQFYILVHTQCPAILSENFFFDNEKECRFLMSNEGRQKIADSHVSAIIKMSKI